MAVDAVEAMLAAQTLGVIRKAHFAKNDTSNLSIDDRSIAIRKLVTFGANSLLYEQSLKAPSGECCGGFCLCDVVLKSMLCRTRRPQC